MHNLKNIYRGGLGGHVCFQCRRYASAKTHYEVLGVSKTASQKEIKSAYIDLSKKYHPDTAGSTSKTRFTELNEAYSVLNKSLSRKEYDNKIAYESASSSNTYHGHYRPPGSGRPGYPPPGSGRPGYPPPGYQRDQGYNQWSNNQQYNPYSESERKREKALRNAREKQFEERLKQFKEFEKDLYNAKTTGKRRFFKFLDFYLGTVFMCSILMTFYGINSLKVTRRSTHRHMRRKYPPELIYQIRLIAFILLAQVIMLMAVLLGRPNPVIRTVYSVDSGRLFKVMRKHGSEIYHGVVILFVILIHLFGLFIMKELLDFYKRMGYDTNEQMHSRSRLKEDGKNLVNVVAYQLLFTVIILFFALRFMFISRTVHEIRKRNDYSELRRRYEYFYGPHGKENRQWTKPSAAEYKSQADQEKELVRVITFCLALALVLTFLRLSGLGKYAAGSKIKSGAVKMGNFDNNPAIVVLSLLFIVCVMSGVVMRKATWHHSNIKKLDQNSRADQIRSPSDDMKAEIDRSIVPKRVEKDITPPRM